MRCLVSILIYLVALGSQARAWGPEGHVVVAMVAEDRLSPKARQVVRKILLGAPLATAALFADEYRVTHQETTRWHFVHIPVDATSFDEARDCKVEAIGDCIIPAIERAKAIIKDPDSGVFDRAEGLKYLVHFVGDLHQPFHAIERKLPNGKGDGGGSKVDVTFFGDKTNLHTLWDSGLILHTGKTAEDYVQHLKQNILAAMRESEWCNGTPVEWAIESHAAAKLAYVDDNAMLGQPYFDANISVVDRRLALAGARIAVILEELFR